MTTELTIRPAITARDYADFGDLCRQYVEWCRRRYEDMPWFIDEVFGYQALDDELTRLAVRYGSPNGRTLVAVTGDDIVAGCAYRRLADGICEMKRLYVSDRAKGHGAGRRLVEALIESARDDGSTAMRLDTGNRHGEAITLYESVGFRRIAAYQDYPARLMPHLVFMERRLWRACQTSCSVTCWSGHQSACAIGRQPAVSPGIVTGELAWITTVSACAARSTGATFSTGWRWRSARRRWAVRRRQSRRRKMRRATTRRR